MRRNVLHHKRNPESGQSTLPEYVLLMFVVIGAAVAITTYIQRGLQARVFDARNYAINQLRSECDGNCLAATGDTVAREYEPYYGHIISETNRQTEDLSSIEGGVANTEGIFRKRTNIQTTTDTTSRQLPPRDAN